jgi:GxxExxY protein
MNNKSFEGDKWLHRELTEKIIGAAMEVHRILGPGFLEYVYEEALCYELEKLGIPFERQKQLDVHYKDIVIPRKYRADLLVDEKVLVDIKATSALTGKDEAQILHYLTTVKLRIGLLLNFGRPSLEVKRRIW